MNFPFFTTSRIIFSIFIKKVIKVANNKAIDQFVGAAFCSLYLRDNKCMILDLRNNFEVYPGILWKHFHCLHDKVQIILEVI